MMSDLGLRQLESCLAGTGLASLRPFLGSPYLDGLRHGDFPRWRKLISALPSALPSRVRIEDVIEIGDPADLEPAQREELELRLRELIPWRKGPFRLFGIGIESEWQCDMKWRRLAAHLPSLQRHTVLDVGCGNGYFCWRSYGAGAKLVVGLEPHLHYVGQFGAVRNYLPETPVYVLPMSLEQWPVTEPAFDTVFSMGVLYHIRSPLDHLLTLKQCLRPGGTLVLESIVVPGETGYALTPERRYARMGNVWFVPSVGTMLRWLERCGFDRIQLIDESPTTEQEQHKSDWMPYDSLQESLDKHNPTLTIEGYPAPRRAMIIACSP